MALSTELMGKGLPHGLATSIGNDAPVIGLTATGSNQAGALALTSSLSFFGTVAASTGALLPAAVGKAIYGVYNGGANTLTVYPNGTEKINQGSAGVSVPAGKAAIFVPCGRDWLAVISA